MKKLKDKHGVGYFTPCIITIVIAMILSAVLFYAECMTIIQTTVENTERVLESFIMKNSIEIYQSIKQGHDFTEDFDENYYISSTSSELSLDSGSGYLYNYSTDGDVVYKMTNPQVSYKVDKSLKLKADYMLMIPVVFAGDEIFDLVIPLTVSRSLTLK